MTRARICKSEKHGFRLIVQNESLTGEQSIGPVSVSRLHQSTKIGDQKLEGLLLVTCGPYGGTFNEPLLFDYQVEKAHKNDIMDRNGRIRYEASASLELVGGDDETLPVCVSRQVRPNPSYSGDDHVVLEKQSISPSVGSWRSNTVCVESTPHTMSTLTEPVLATHSLTLSTMKLRYSWAMNGD